MNEIVGTLYFVLAHDSNEDWSNEAEADTYFLFNALMVEMRDVFVPDLDEADTGIHGRISNMITLLSLHDPEVRCHLDSVGIDPSFYSVRWLTTLLSSREAQRSIASPAASASGVGYSVPALLTSTSTRPQVCATCASSRSTAMLHVRSHEKAWQVAVVRRDCARASSAA